MIVIAGRVQRCCGMSSLTSNSTPSRKPASLRTPRLEIAPRGLVENCDLALVEAQRRELFAKKLHRVGNDTGAAAAVQWAIERAHFDVDLTHAPQAIRECGDAGVVIRRVGGE